MARDKTTTKGFIEAMEASMEARAEPLPATRTRAEAATESRQFGREVDAWIASGDTTDPAPFVDVQRSAHATAKEAKSWALDFGVTVVTRKGRVIARRADFDRGRVAYEKQNATRAAEAEARKKARDGT